MGRPPTFPSDLLHAVGKAPQLKWSRNGKSILVLDTVEAANVMVPAYFPNMGNAQVRPYYVAHHLRSRPPSTTTAAAVAAAAAAAADSRH